MTKVEAKFVEGKVKTLSFSALVTAGRERVRKCADTIILYQFDSICTEYLVQICCTYDVCFKERYMALPRSALNCFSSRFNPEDEAIA